jgi:hypothetical protein
VQSGEAAVSVSCELVCEYGLIEELWWANRRQRGHAPEIINVSWKAQRRLNARWRQRKDARHKPGGIVAVAIARELAAYC